MTDVTAEQSTLKKNTSVETPGGSISKAKYLISHVFTDEKLRLILLLFILWAGIGYMDLMKLSSAQDIFSTAPDYPVSFLYVLVIFPAAAIFGWTGFAVASAATIVMYHFTNDKRGMLDYNEIEIIRLGFVSLIGIGFARVSQDRQRLRGTLGKLRHETQVREDLTHMIVHDLRTPLTGIITSMQTLQQGILGDLDPDQQEMVDFAVTDGQRLLEMVNQILDVAKLESGEMKLRLEDVQLSELAENACRIMAPIAQESDVRINHNCDGLTAQVDLDLMRRVLVNIMGNAVKFTPKDGEVSVFSLPESGSMVHLVVKDTGYGIPEADLQLIFEKYGQSKNKGRGPSTGLGLTFCRLAVEAHGGKIWAESELGKGTEIHIQFPSRQVGVKR